MPRTRVRDRAKKRVKRKLKHASGVKYIFRNRVQTFLYSVHHQTRLQALFTLSLVM